MITLNENQLKELDELLDKLPHAYAKAIILLIQKFNKENNSPQVATEVAEEVPEVEVV